MQNTSTENDLIENTHVDARNVITVTNYQHEIIQGKRLGNTLISYFPEAEHNLSLFKPGRPKSIAIVILID